MLSQVVVGGVTLLFPMLDMLSGPRAEPPVMRHAVVEWLKCGAAHTTPGGKPHGAFLACLAQAAGEEALSRRALALAVTIQISRHRKRVNFGC